MWKTQYYLYAVTCFILFLSCLAFAGISIEGGLTHEKIMNAPGTYQGEIVIRNQDEGPQEMKVYQSDYSFNYEGETFYGDPGKDSRSNAPWITLSPSRLTIPPKDKATISYTVIVPDDRPLIGTYWSMIMLECLPQDSPESAGAKKEKRLSMGITQVMRYALQVVTHIDDTGTRQIKFIQSKVLKEKDARILQVDLENIGERLVRPLLWAELYTADGVSLGRYPGEQFRIYPNTSKRFRIDISKAPAGTLKALVVADCGENDLMGIQYTLKLEN